MTPEQFTQTQQQRLKLLEAYAQTNATLSDLEKQKAQLQARAAIQLEDLVNLSTQLREHERITNTRDESSLGVRGGNLTPLDAALSA